MILIGLFILGSLSGNQYFGRMVLVRLLSIRVRMCQLLGRIDVGQMALLFVCEYIHSQNLWQIYLVGCTPVQQLIDIHGL